MIMRGDAGEAHARDRFGADDDVAGRAAGLASSAGPAAGASQGLAKRVGFGPQGRCGLGEGCRHRRRSTDPGAGWQCRGCRRRHAPGAGRHVGRCVLHRWRSSHPGLRRLEQKRPRVVRPGRRASRPCGDRMVSGARHPGRRGQGSGSAGGDRRHRDTAQNVWHEELCRGRAAHTEDPRCRRSHMVHRYGQPGEDRNRCALAGRPGGHLSKAGGRRAERDGQPGAAPAGRCRSLLSRRHRRRARELVQGEGRLSA